MITSFEEFVREIRNASLADLRKVYDSVREGAVHELAEWQQKQTTTTTTKEEEDEDNRESIASPS